MMKQVSHFSINVVNWLDIPAQQSVSKVILARYGLLIQVGDVFSVDKN